MFSTRRDKKNTFHFKKIPSQKKISSISIIAEPFSWLHGGEDKLAAYEKSWLKSIATWSERVSLKVGVGIRWQAWVSSLNFCHCAALWDTTRSGLARADSLGWFSLSQSSGVRLVPHADRVNTLPTHNKLNSVHFFESVISSTISFSVVPSIFPASECIPMSQFCFRCRARSSASLENSPPMNSSGWISRFLQKSKDFALPSSTPRSEDHFWCSALWSNPDPYITLKNHSFD